MVIDGTEKTLDSSSELSQQPMRESFNPMYKMNSLEDNKTELDSVCNVMSVMDLNSVDKDVAKLSYSEVLEKSENNKNLIDKEVVIDTTLSLDAVIGNLEAIKISKAVDESADDSECGGDIKLEANVYRKCLELVDNEKNQHKECEKQIAQDHNEVDDENDNVNDDDVLVSRGPCGGIPIQNRNSVPYNPSWSISPGLDEFLTNLSSDYNYDFMPKNFDDPYPTSKFIRPNANVSDIPKESINFNNGIHDSASFNPTLVTARVALMPNNSTIMQSGLENNVLDLFGGTSNFTAASAQHRPTIAGGDHSVPCTQLLSADLNDSNFCRIFDGNDGFLSNMNEDDIEAFAERFYLEGLDGLDDLLESDEPDTCCDTRLGSDNPANDIKSQGSPTSLKDSGIGSPPSSHQMSKSPETLWPNSPLSDQCLPSPVSSFYYEETIESRASSKRKLEPPSYVLPPVENDSMLIGFPIPKCVEEYPTSEEIRIEAERKRNNMVKNDSAAKSNVKPKSRVARKITSQETEEHAVYEGCMRQMNQPASSYPINPNYPGAAMTDALLANEGIEIKFKPELSETKFTTAYQPCGNSSTIVVSEDKVKRSKAPDIQRRPILPKPSDVTTSRQIIPGFNNAAQPYLTPHQLHPLQQQQLHELLRQQPSTQLQQQQLIQQVIQRGERTFNSHNSRICESMSDCLQPPTSIMSPASEFLQTQPANVTPAMGHQILDGYRNNIQYQPPGAVQILQQPHDLELPPPRQIRPRPQQAKTPPRSRDDELRANRWIAEIKRERLIQQDEHGLSLLHQVIMNDKTTTLQVEAIINRLKREGLLDTILAMGSEVNKTPLCLAVMMNRPELVKLLVDNGADVNVKLRGTQDGITTEYHLLHYIASKGSIMQEVLKQLLTDQKINVDVFDSSGVTPLHLAVKSHKLRCLNQNGGNSVDSQSIIFILADMGEANLNIGDRTGRTPLHYAIEKRDRHLVEWYLALTVHIARRQAAPGSNPELDARAVVQRYITTPTKEGMNALTIASTLTPDNQQKAELINLLLQKNS